MWIPRFLDSLLMSRTDGIEESRTLVDMQMAEQGGRPLEYRGRDSLLTRNKACEVFVSEDIVMCLLKVIGGIGRYMCLYTGSPRDHMMKR